MCQVFGWAMVRLMPLESPLEVNILMRCEKYYHNIQDINIQKCFEKKEMFKNQAGTENRPTIDFSDKPATDAK